MSPHRKIIHIDMDAFYASVEQLDNPELRGKPLAVGGDGVRGVVAAASYEARKYGVKSAMPSTRAARLCPDLIFVKPRFARYKEISRQIHAIFHEYTDIVEPLALDEAYLDVSSTKTGSTSATLVAQEIKAKIKLVTGLTASAGISYNKFLAKIASDMDKPNGLYVVLPSEAEAFIEKLAIRKFHGIGAVTAEKMKHAGIFRGADLKQKSLEDLCLRFGKQGQYYYNIARGIDNRSVVSSRTRKSISAENTFSKDLMTVSKIQEKLAPITDEVWNRQKKHGVPAKTVTIKVKYGDFKQITRSKSIDGYITGQDQLKEVIESLIDQSLLSPEGIRLLGVGLSNFKEETSPQTTQLTLDF